MDLVQKIYAAPQYHHHQEVLNQLENVFKSKEHRAKHEEVPKVIITTSRRLAQCLEQQELLENSV